jgi:hypothetical protein
MNEMHRPFILSRLLPFAFAVLLLTGCGTGYGARGKVKDFLKSNLKQPDIEILEWSELDSTFRIGDSTVQVMHRAAAPMLKANASYVKASPQLRYLNALYVAGKDTMKCTFYLDDKLTGVVAFMRNPL